MESMRSPSVQVKYSLFGSTLPLTWEAHRTLQTVRGIIRHVRQSHLQEQVGQSGEHREDRQQVCEPRPSQFPLQIDAFPKKGGHVEVQVHVIDVVKRR